MTLFTKESLEELKKKVSLQAILFQMFDCEHVFMDRGCFEGKVMIYGVCPFCKKKDSLVAIEDNDKYFCFNCEAHGDALTLLMNAKEWSFQETVEFLAKRFDVKLEEASKEKGKYYECSQDMRNKRTNLMRRLMELMGKVTDLETKVEGEKQ